MAKKKASNKSDAVRKYVAANPSAGPTAVQEAMAKKGIEVSTALVSKIRAESGSTRPRKSAKRSAKKTAKKAKRAGRAASANGRPAEETPLDDLKHAGNLMMEAVELVMKAGAAEAKQLVNLAADMVKKIRD